MVDQKKDPYGLSRAAMSTRELAEEMKRIEEYAKLLNSRSARITPPTIMTSPRTSLTSQSVQTYQQMVHQLSTSSAGYMPTLGAPAWDFAHPQDSVIGFMERVEDDLAQRQREGNAPGSIVMHGLTWNAISVWAQDHPQDAGLWRVSNSKTHPKMMDFAVSILWEMPEWEWIFSDPSPFKNPISFIAHTIGRFSHDNKSASIRARRR